MLDDLESIVWVVLYASLTLVDNKDSMELTKALNQSLNPTRQEIGNRVKLKRRAYDYIMDEEPRYWPKSLWHLEPLLTKLFKVCARAKSKLPMVNPNLLDPRNKDRIRDYWEAVDKVSEYYLDRYIGLIVDFLEE